VNIQNLFRALIEFWGGKIPGIASAGEFEIEGQIIQFGIPPNRLDLINTIDGVSFEEANGDAAFIAKALGDIARAKGMSQVARDAGLSRESLYKALSGERNPGFDTILKVMGALGLKLHAEAVHSTHSAAKQ
jgi:probable addiction module antidote protein